MKAILVRHPIHTTLETSGESWQQGDILKGQLTYKNESNEAQVINSDLAGLFSATIKEVREGKLPQGKALYQIEIPAQLLLAPGEEKQFAYEFKLSTDMVISDKSSGPFFFFGSGTSKLSSLALSVTPHQRLQELLQNIELFLRFKTKSIKAKKDKVEIKMLPPPSKEYSSLEGLTMLLKFLDETIHIEFHFKVKKLDYSGVGNAPVVEKGVIKKKVALTPNDYLIFGKAFNGERVAALVDGTLEEIKTKTLI